MTDRSSSRPDDAVPGGGPDAAAAPGGPDAAGAAASRLLETIPLVLRALRRDVRLPSGEAFSIPRFHALLFIERHPGTDLSGVSGYLGATLPATSELVKRLVGSGLVTRAPNASERRRVHLALTDSGVAELGATRAEARSALRGLVAGLDPEQLSSLADVLGELHAVLARRDTASS